MIYFTPKVSLIIWYENHCLKHSKTQRCNICIVVSNTCKLEQRLKNLV